MNPYLNVLVAQSAAHERERDLQRRLRQIPAARRQSDTLSPPAHRHPWLRAALTRLRLVHARP